MNGAGDGGPSTPRIFAVVVAYAPEAASFAQLLMATAGQAETVIVVDNGHRAGLDSTAWSERLEHIDMGGNAGVAAAQNAGIRRAFARGASHVLLLDHDSIPEPGMTSRLLEASLTLRASGQQVAAVGADYRDPRHQAPSPFVTMGWFGYRRIAAQADGAAIPVPFLISSGSLIAHEAYAAVGEMDERLFIDYVDIEWCLRAGARGWRAFGVPGAHLHHRLGDAALAWRDGGPPIRLRGRTLPSRSPLRHYYLFRNGIWLMLRGSLPLRWKLLEAKRLAGCIGAFALFAERRGEQLAAMFSGLADGVRGRMGPAGLPHPRPG